MPSSPSQDAFVRLSARFVSELSEIASEKALRHAKRLVTLISQQPDMGSPQVSPSLAARFGENLRFMALDGYLVLYRHENGAVEFLAFLSGPTVH